MTAAEALDLPAAFLGATVVGPADEVLAHSTGHRRAWTALRATRAGRDTGHAYLIVRVTHPEIDGGAVEVRCAYV